MATTSVDIIGVVESVDEPSTITRRDGSEAQKRSITLRDDSNKSIELTFWGDYAANPGDQLEGVGNPLNTLSSPSTPAICHYQGTEEWASGVSWGCSNDLLRYNRLQPAVGSSCTRTEGEPYCLEGWGSRLCIICGCLAALQHLMDFCFLSWRFNMSCKKGVQSVLQVEACKPLKSVAQL